MNVKNYKRNVRRLAKKRGLEIQSKLEKEFLKFIMETFILKVPVHLDLTSGKAILTVPTNKPEVPRPSDIVWGFNFMKEAQQIQFEREGIVCR